MSVPKVSVLERVDSKCKGHVRDVIAVLSIIMLQLLLKKCHPNHLVLILRL